MAVTRTTKDKFKMIKKLIFSVAMFTLATNSLVLKADTAVFAGGCFWCIEALYQELEGVSDARSGFTGGTLKNPTYSGNHEGHYEAVEVVYDPEVVSYAELLDLFWVNIDPLDNRGQFCDKGPSYRSAIFVSNASERELAEATRRTVMDRFKQEVFTEILPVATFYPVEEYHQDYYTKNPLRYRFYRSGCRRDSRLKALWGDSALH